MAERLILIMSGLDGLAVLHWLLGYEDRWRGVVHVEGSLTGYRRLGPASTRQAVQQGSIGSPRAVWR